jgi:hypothetical protein
MSALLELGKVAVRGALSNSLEADGEPLTRLEVGEL